MSGASGDANDVSLMANSRTFAAFSAGSPMAGTDLSVTPRVAELPTVPTMVGIVSGTTVLGLIVGVVGEALGVGDPIIGACTALLVLNTNTMVAWKRLMVLMFGASPPKLNCHTRF